MQRYAGFSMSDIYPGFKPVATTAETTQPDEAEAVKFATTEQGTIIDRRKKMSIFGFLLVLVIALVALGVINAPGGAE